MQCTRFYLYFAVILEFVEKPGAGSLLSDQGRDGGVCLISPSIWPPDICNPASIWSYILSCAEAVWYFMTRKKKKRRIRTAVFLPCRICYLFNLYSSKIQSAGFDLLSF